MRRIAFASLLLPLSACFLSRELTNTPIAPDKAERLSTLTPGTSTQQDVLAVMGAPTRVVELYKRSAWEYEHLQQKGAYLFLGVVSFSNHDEQSDRAWCFFDEAGVLMCAGSTLQANTSEYAMPWFSVHATESAKE
jgi:outer membrane protein assembly factor BamE (lipoprotein component of BamABCDE complex)